MLVTALVTILVFLVLISLHEFGHFAAAKLVGVRVLEFSIGMGPAIFKHQGKKTLYSLRIFPIGGYCKLEGENEKSDDPEAFLNQKLWKRITVVLAGAFLNLVLGFVVFAVVVKMMSPMATNTVDKLDERAYIVNSGIKTGDKITAVNGHKIDIYNDIAGYMSEVNENTEFVTVTVNRNGQKMNFDVKPSLDEITVVYDKNSATYIDVINGIEEKGVTEYDDGVIPAEYIGKTFNEKRYLIGFSAKQEEITIKNVLPNAWNYTKYVVKSIYKALWELVSGKSGLENLSGPVGVAVVINDAVHSGSDSLLNVLFIVALLSLNLGIFNLLPLPALDGGRFFFMLVELVSGKPVPPEKEGMVHTVGLMLFLILAAVICFSDIVKIVG